MGTLMNLASLEEKELAVLHRLTGKWSRKYPAFGAALRAALVAEQHRRLGYDKRKPVVQLPALPREQMCNLVFALVWSANNIKSGGVGRVGAVILWLAREMIDLTLKQEAELGISDGTPASFSSWAQEPA